VVVTGVVLTSVLFALAGFINAVFANSFDDISIIPTFVLTPLIYLGGVFYSLDLLPDFWAAVSKMNPLVYVVNAFRYGVLGVADVSVAFAFSMLGGLPAGVRLQHVPAQQRHAAASVTLGTPGRRKSHGA
jgi:ABC-2 type transport system permease protein